MRSGNPTTSPISDRTSRFIAATVADDPAGVREHLAARRVALVLDPAWGESFAGQAITFALLNMLVRLDDYCPALQVVVPAVERHRLLRLLAPDLLRGGLADFFAPFPAAGRLTFVEPDRCPADDGLRILVSPTPVAGAVSIWADGWLAYLNEAAPLRSGDENPVGAHVAAGLAAAEVFKRLIAGLRLRPGLKVLPTERLIFSAFDYGLVVGPNPALPRAIDVDGAVVIGLGGIGAAFVAAASCLPALAGTLTLVDGDSLGVTNLNRQLMSRPGDAGYKVDLCRRALAFHDKVAALPEWFDAFVERQGDRLDIAIVGVDDDKVRRAIQGRMPRLVLNAGTSDVASFRVTRHDYLGGACLACIARGDLRDHPAERELARQLGVGLDTILALQSSGERLSAARLRETGVLDEDTIARLGDQSVEEIRRLVCAELQLDTGPESPAVSISFLSALPGFLLLGELIKERAYGGAARPPLNGSANHALWSVLGRPHPALLRDWRDKRADCDCARDAYRRAYRRKWGAKW